MDIMQDHLRKMVRGGWFCYAGGMILTKSLSAALTARQPAKPKQQGGYQSQLLGNGIYSHIRKSTYRSRQHHG